MSSKSIWWPGNVDITCDVDEVIDQIPTSALENELEERKDLQKKDVKECARQERYRTWTIEITINPEDYNLVDVEDVEVSDFEDQQIIDYLERSGYCVFKKGVANTSDMDSVRMYLEDVPAWKFKEAMCDLLGISHTSTKDEIINKLKERI